MIRFHSTLHSLYKYILPGPPVNTYKSGPPSGRLVTAALFAFALGVSGSSESQAQIVINIPSGVTKTYSTISNENHRFVSDGTGKVSFTGNNGGFTKSLSFDEVEAVIGYDSSFSNVGEIRIRSSSLFVYKKNHNQVSDTASIYLNSGNLDFFYNYSYGTVENIGDIVLDGGYNMIGMSPVRHYYANNQRVVANNLIRSSQQATLYFYQHFNWDDNGSIVFWATLAFKAAPQAINGIMPYSVNAVAREDDLVKGIEYYFSAPFLWKGQWEIGSWVEDYSGQSSWNSPTLNVALGSNQTLSANRTINSLTILPSHSLNLAGRVLSVNSGGVLTASLVVRNRIDTSPNSILGGAITTPQPRYFFHVYGGRLTVSSVISGSGKEFIKSGPGILRFQGAEPNTYTGDTYVHSGVLELNKSPRANSVRNVTLTKGVEHETELKIMQSHQIDDSATVTLNRGAIFSFAGAGGVGLTEKIHTLQADGQGVIDFAGGTFARANVLETTRVLLPTADDTLFIRNWIEFSDYFLVSRAFAPNSAALSRIWFEGWSPGSKLRDYNSSYWEIVPLAAPEPATYGALLGTLGIGAYLIRRNRQKGRRTSECAAK